MSKINYVIGDATAPQGEDKRIICHIVNNKNTWGSGFVIALSRKWSFPEDHYRARKTYPLGHVDLVDVGDNIFVANMIGQHGIRNTQIHDDFPPIRYEAVRQALRTVNGLAVSMGASLHMPRIGSDRAGGNWNIISSIIEQCTSVPVTVYDLP